MRRLLRFGLVVMLALGATMPAAWAGGRMALVVGVARYDRVPELKNSANDARDMAQALRGLGFDVTEVVDPDQRGLQDAISRFLNRLSDADLALFYYSGHGIQMGERNYLVPRDAALESPVDVPLRSVDLGVVLDGMETRAKVRVVLLDACRDNPFAGIFRNRSVARGLGSMSAALGTLVGFATAPGAVAADGDGRNSPFARALLKHLPTPGLDVTQLMRLVRADVVSATGGQQVPWDHSSLIGEIALSPSSPAQAATTVVAASTATSLATEAPSTVPKSTTSTLDEALALYRDKPGQKAFAVSGTGGWGYAYGVANGQTAMDRAVQRCNEATGRPCRVSDMNGKARPARDDSAGEALQALARRKVASASFYADERRNFGVAAPADLHKPYHDKTPLTVPGASLVATPQLVTMLQGQSPPVLVDVRSGDGQGGSLPGAVWLKGAGLAEPSTDALFPRLMDRLAADRSRAVVFFCTGPDCWLSWNASVRAARLGYTAVHWYRGGIAAWTKARLPIVPVELAGNLEP